MFVGQRAARLQFDDQTPAYQQVREIVSNDCSVFVVNRQGELLRNFNAGFSQAVRQGVFVDLLQMPVPMIQVLSRPTNSDLMRR